MGAPFHDGELEVQARLGLGDIAQRAGRLVRDHLIDQHRDFYAALPFIVAAARDDAGRPWATLLVGPPGFLQSPDPQTLRIAATPRPGDALAGALSRADPQGRALGLLGIDFATRRRNRVNGLVAGHEG
ncbi:MAG: flavin-nucleotide-binding protein, partial [Myxococcales bacterium]|nr:flavin-nucleotide-binding protein [Myxococcales bacterium]